MVRICILIVLVATNKCDQVCAFYDGFVINSVLVVTDYDLITNGHTTHKIGYS